MIEVRPHLVILAVVVDFLHHLDRRCAPELVSLAVLDFGVKQTLLLHIVERLIAVVVLHAVVVVVVDIILENGVTTFLVLVVLLVEGHAGLLVALLLLALFLALLFAAFQDLLDLHILEPVR